MKKAAEAALLQRLKREDSAAFALLYDFYYPQVAAYIQQNSGSLADAEDIFQETIVVLLQKLRMPGFTLTAGLQTYLYAIARNLWLKKLRDEKRLAVRIQDAPAPLHEPHEPALHPEKTTEEKLASLLLRITHNCRRVLRAIFLYHEGMDSLMKRMGWKNRHTAANQQYKCIQQARRETLKANITA